MNMCACLCTIFALFGGLEYLEEGACGAAPDCPESCYIFEGAPDHAADLCLKYCGDCTVFKAIYPDNELLGMHLYDLAIHAGDISDAINMERFQRGVSGAHYDVEQYVAWANAEALSQNAAHPLIQFLVDQKVLRWVGPVLFPVDPYRHIVFVTEGIDRTMEENLRHELLHVHYTRSEAFRHQIQHAWDTLSPSEQDEAIAALKGYNKEEIPQLIEEWGVREAEKQIANEGAPAAEDPDRGVESTTRPIFRIIGILSGH